MAAPRFLARNPYITNDAADDPLGNSQIGPRAMEAFQPWPIQRASRPALDASRLQLTPPIGLLTGICERVQDFSVFLNELNARQIRPRCYRNVLSGNFAPKHLPQHFMEAPVVALAEQTLMLRVLANRQLRAAAAAADRVRRPLAPSGPCFRHGRSAGRALFDFNRLFARIAHQKSPKN